jgi:hypothetical protein
MASGKSLWSLEMVIGDIKSHVQLRTALETVVGDIKSLKMDSEPCLFRFSSENWLTWISKALIGGTLSVKINDSVGPYFCSHKGVRQGDPFAPSLFNVVVNCLSKMIQIATQNDLIAGLADHVIEGGCAILQYADDTILFIQDDMESARNLKLLIYIFESMSGLKINFEKSEVLIIESDDAKLQTYTELFNCQAGSWPIKYLGTLVCARRTIAEMKLWKKISNREWKAG